MKNTGFTPETKRIIHARSADLCEVCEFPRWADQVHHRRPRQSGGSKAPDTNGLANGLDVCTTHHNRIESHRAEAYANGWLVHSWEQPDETRLVYRGRWALLDNSGDVTLFEEAD